MPKACGKMRLSLGGLDAKEFRRTTPHEVGVARPTPSIRQAAVALRRGSGTSVRTRARARSASTDHGPGPTAKRIGSSARTFAYSDSPKNPVLTLFSFNSSKCGTQGIARRLSATR
jgi:hypothetical protein